MHKKKYYWKKIEHKPPLPSLNKDILYEIALNTDINDLKYLSLTNQNYLQIIESKQFWIDKYRREDLPIITLYHTINDWIKDYKAALKTVQLLWLNNMEQSILEKNIGLVLNVSEPTINDVNHLPLPEPVHVDNTLTHFRILIINDNIQLECYFDEGPVGDVLFNFDNVDTIDKIIIIKHLFLHDNHLLFISDFNGIRYHLKDLLNNMVDIDNHYDWRRYSGDVIDLRKSLMIQYHLDF